VVSATTSDVEGSKQACVKGTSARFSRAKRASLLLEKHATSYTVVPFSDRSRTLLLLYATRTYT